MIPSNTTAKEFAKYYIQTAERQDIQDRFEELIDRMEQLETIALQADRIEERLREQLGFARDLVSSIKEQAEAAKRNTRKSSGEWNLANYLVNEIENSYFEL